MKPLCFIAARGGSKGVPRKNIRKICGKPLIVYSIESAIESKIFSHVVVSTDDAEIATIAKKSGAEVPFIRPKKLANDSAGMSEVLLHGIKKLYSLGYNFDVFVNRDCTAPFIRNTDIRKAINLLKKQKCDMVIGVYKQHLNPYFNMLELNTRGFLKLSKSSVKRPKSRQDAPVVYQLNGLFIYDTKKFLKIGEAIMPKSMPCEIPPETGLMIDTEFEFKIAEQIIKNKMVNQY